MSTKPIHQTRGGLLAGLLICIGLMLGVGVAVDVNHAPPGFTWPRPDTAFKGGACVTETNTRTPVEAEIINRETGYPEDPAKITNVTVVGDPANPAIPLTLNFTPNPIPNTGDSSAKASFDVPTSYVGTVKVRAHIGWKGDPGHDLLIEIPVEKCEPLVTTTTSTTSTSTTSTSTTSTTQPTTTTSTTEPSTTTTSTSTTSTTRPTTSTTAPSTTTTSTTSTTAPTTSTTSSTVPETTSTTRPSTSTTVLDTTTTTAPSTTTTVCIEPSTTTAPDGSTSPPVCSPPPPPAPPAPPAGAAPPAPPTSSLPVTGSNAGLMGLISVTLMAAGGFILLGLRYDSRRNAAA